MNFEAVKLFLRNPLVVLVGAALWLLAFLWKKATGSDLPNAVLVGMGGILLWLALRAEALTGVWGNRIRHALGVASLLVTIAFMASPKWAAEVMRLAPTTETQKAVETLAPDTIVTIQPETAPQTPPALPTPGRDAEDPSGTDQASGSGDTMNETTPDVNDEQASVNDTHTNDFFDAGLGLDAEDVKKEESHDPYP